MPPPITVELVPHDPRWAALAAAESRALAAALQDILVVVHHIGSTAVPGIRAKPIIDLIPVVRGLDLLDEKRPQIEALGYGWRGEYGLPGRRYCFKDDPATGRRLCQLHCYDDGNPEIARHLAFRDYLVERPDLARQYEAEKRRCAASHPHDSHAYADCKEAWISRIERDALRFFGG